MKLSISSVFTYFECYTEIFANIPVWFNNEVQKLYNIIIWLTCFEQYFLSLNTVISGNFGKNIFATLTSHFLKFSYKSLLLASYHDDINAVGATEKFFYGNE